MAWYLFLVRHSHLASFASGWWLCLCLSYSQNSPSLVAPTIFPAWLLANQHFIKPIRVLRCIRALSHSRTNSLCRPGWPWVLELRDQPTSGSWVLGWKHMHHGLGFLNFFFTLYVCFCLHLHIWTISNAQGDKKRESDLLKSELQTIVCLHAGDGNESGSSARAASALNHSAIAPALKNYFQQNHRKIFS